MSPMRCAKGVVDERIRQGRQALGKGWIVIFLADVEPQVLQHQHAARGNGRDRGLHLGTDAVRGLGDGLAEKLRKPCGHRGQPHILDHLALGTPQV